MDKNGQTIWYLQEIYFKYNIGRLEVKRWKKTHHDNVSQKKAEMTILILNRDFRPKINLPKMVKRDIV